MPEFDADLIVPVFNEEKSLPLFFERLQKLDLPARVIFVDNASTDGSRDLLDSYPGATVIKHTSNQGYGASLLDGMRAGRSDRIAIIDADCEYPPECLPALLKALDEHDVVYASRLLEGGAAAMPWMKALGNRIISGAFNRLFRQNVTDLYTGCKAFKRRCLDAATLRQTGFEHVLELAVQLSARGYVIHEIPVAFARRQGGKSKMRHGVETVKYVYWLLRYAVSLRRDIARNTGTR